MGDLWYNLVNRKMPKSNQNSQKVAKKGTKTPQIPDFLKNIAKWLT